MLLVTAPEATVLSDTKEEHGGAWDPRQSGLAELRHRALCLDPIRRRPASKGVRHFVVITARHVTAVELPSCNER